MLKVLIVDDTQEKIVQIRQVMDGFVENPDDIPISGSIREGLKACTKDRYDLVILDLFIPEKAGEVPNPENAKTFLKLIKEDDDYICPIFVIGITRMQDVVEYKSYFEAETLQILWYAENDDTWKEQLKNRLEYLIGVKRNLGVTYDYDYDVAIINALQTPEHEIMRTTLGKEWEELNLDDDNATTYYKTVLKTREGKDVRCISCYAPQMASVASAALTTKVILRFHPKYLFMTGICAALKGDDVSFGDIMVASQVWDGMSGKYIEQNKDGVVPELVFEPDYRPIPLDAAMLNIVNRLKEKNSLLNEIRECFDGVKPETPLRIHAGPMTSVPSVIASEKKIAEIKVHARKLVGIEMESYGLFYAAEHAHKLKPIYTASFKSASDLADKNKTDEFQPYAAYTSAAIVKYIIENELSFNDN
jgi:nucleoside phosphorylase/CheY-like chemotaxis protein